MGTPGKRAVGIVDLALGLGAHLAFRRAWSLRRRAAKSGDPMTDAAVLANMALPLVAACLVSSALHHQSPTSRFGLLAEPADPLWAIGAIVGAQAIGIIPQLIDAKLNGPPPEPREPELSGTPLRGYDLYAPISEELMMRGLLQAGAAAIVPLPIAVVAQGIFFGLLHLKTPRGRDVRHAFEATYMGVGMGTTVALNRNRLIPPILAHYTFNFLGPVMAKQMSARQAAKAAAR